MRQYEGRNDGYDGRLSKEELENTYARIKKKKRQKCLTFRTYTSRFI